MDTVSSVYADYVFKTEFNCFSSEVIYQVKILVLDLVGVSLAGYKMMDFPRTVVDYVTGLGGIQEATVFQKKKKYPAINAVLANSACAHALDMDDGHRIAALHPGAVIIPTAIAAGESANAPIHKVIAGIVVGYEVMIRLGMAIMPSSLNRGFHITGITGPFGAVAVAGKILGLTRDEIIGAFGLAGLQASGLIQVNHEAEGAKVKPLNPARAASSGILSCALAQKGFKGPLNIFEGNDGFFKAVADEINYDLLAHGLGNKYEIFNVYIKLHSACRHTHAPIDAAMKAFANSHLDISEIDKIYVETYPAALRLSSIKNPTTTSAARFSTTFSVALSLIKNGADADKYTEKNIGDRNIHNLADRIELSLSNKWKKLYPIKRGATVCIVDHNKRTWSAEVELPKGEPENPPTWEEIYNKFLKNATSVISYENAKNLAEIIMNLENSSLYDFVSLI